MNKMKKKKSEKKEWVVVLPEDVQKQLRDAPKEVREGVEAIMKGFTDGSLQPDEVGVPINFNNLVEKLKCNECSSMQIDWGIDDEDEVYYKCNTCKNAGWMTKETYEKAKKDNPDLLFK